MAANTQASMSQEDVAYEKNFSRENTWRNFKMALFTALSGSTFIAALSVIAQKIVGAAEGIGAVAGAAGGTTAAASGSTSFFGALFANPALTVPLLVGMVAVGVASAYMATSEGTEIKRLQDDRLARQNAREQQRCREQGVCNEVEYPQNQREDGKKWENVVAAKPQLQLVR